MAKHLGKILGVFGQSGTRLLIIDHISRNGNSMNKELLIEKVIAETKIQRQSVRKHFRKMVAKGELIINGENVTLKNPVNVIPKPWESWTIAGIPLAAIFLTISLWEGNLMFRLGMVILTAYCVIINARDILVYLRKVRYSK